MSTLKPVGVFWDIENCCVPRGKSALKIIERIRDKFFDNCREAEFICVCDITKESDSTIKDLNDGQINVVHINATAKNAADDKIRQSLRRFSDSHPPGTKVILISSDVNFAGDLSDLRHRKKYEVCLIHKAQVSDALLTCASEHHLYEDLIKDLPDRPGYKESKENVLVVQGYNKDSPLDKVKQVLKMLSNNCGGKVVSIGPLFAVLKFETPELLERAKSRMNGEDVYGRKITVFLPDETPFGNTVRKLSAAHQAKRQESPSPQRRLGKERSNSWRSFTPEGYEGGVYGGSNVGLGDAGQQCGQKWGRSSYECEYDSFIPPYSNASYKTPEGSTYHQQGSRSTQSLGGQGPSPSHTHTLPDSNSAKYYSAKSGPVPTESLPFSSASSSGGGGSKGLSAVGTSGYVIGDLSAAASGSAGTITVFKSTEKCSLADIPIPSFGFRDIPPPSMPVKSTGSSSLDPNATAFDPIKLVECASQDSRAFVTSKLSKSSGMGPPHPDSQPAQQSTPTGRPGVSSNQTKVNIGGLPTSQGSAFTKHQPTLQTSSSSSSLAGTSTSASHHNHNQQHQQHNNPPQLQQPHQSRSLSVPVRQHELTLEDEICIMHGYPPASAYRSHSQNSSAFKKPASPHKNFKNQPSSNGYNCRISPVNRCSGLGNRDVRHSVSSDGEDRPYSPINAHPKSDFRARIPSAPNNGGLMSSTAPPTGQTPAHFSGPAPPRPRSRQYGSHLYRVPTPDEIGDPSTDYTHPNFNAVQDPSVELVVSNLDYNIQPREWRKIIYATFHPHVKILSIQVRIQADNTSVATIRLPTEQDARFAIAQFHRRKIGYKRINVQFKSDCSQSPADSLRMDTIALLMEAKDNKMALSRLIDLFDKRFHKTVSVSDIYKMRDTIQILDSGGAGRWVKLQPGIKRSPTPTHMMEGEVAEVLEQPVCPIHCAEGSVYYTEALNSCMLPNVLMLRKHFAPQLHSLLLSHNGYLPLMSFPACYSAEFKPIEPVSEGGIPLEHVISCVPGVEITMSKAGVKIIQFQENREQFYDMMKNSSWQELGKISREVMELLRQHPTCTMPVSKFIPAYHHHFGRQCRVADYGYTKLQELFEAIPHAIQVLGTGDRKAITLSFRAQLKRLTTDILKVVKAQPSKQIMLDDFPQAYEKVMGKPLFLPHYGVCYVEDVLMDIPTTTLIVIEEDSHILLALPRRDQTPEEVERTKQFALEVVDLLKQHPQCCMPFNKFIPAYHHHFGRQCKVSEYGFSKLTDLFEAISHVAEIEEEGEERLIHLSSAEKRKVLCEQLTCLIRPAGAILVDKIVGEYAKLFGFCLKLDDFGAESTKALLLKLKNHFKIDVRYGQEYATLVEEFHIPSLGLQVMQLLMDESGGCLPLVELCSRYESLFGVMCDVGVIREELSDYVQIDDEESDAGSVIRLTSQQMLGRNLRLLLLHQQRISLSNLTSLYRQQYGVELSSALYGFSTLPQLLQSFPHILELSGRPPNKYIVLSGGLPTPDTLPPARVDVTSPTQFFSASPVNIQDTQGSASTASKSSGASDLLRHASQMWDSSLATQAPVADPSSHSVDQGSGQATRIMDMLSSSMAAASLGGGGGGGSKKAGPKGKEALSPNGVPVAWQMKAGGDKVVSGNIGGLSSQASGSPPSALPMNSNKSPKSSKTSGGGKVKPKNSCSKEGKGAVSDEGKDTTGQENVKIGDTPQGFQNIRTGHNSSNEEAEEDMFSPTNPPLDTSSTNSQHNSSSQSSIASPVKRRPRIAANFKQGN